ncbi:MAG TPA: hypothetical protein VGM39_12435 [Kofleriaceae bacterium]
MRTSQLVLRGALFAAMLPFTTAASCDSGDRAETGDCPSGETCSDETPNGLHFRGPVIAEGFFDGGEVKRTAIGGTQDVQIVTETDDGTQSPFLLPHAIRTNNGKTKITSASANAFTLRAAASGTTMVSVVDPSTGDLFDRIEVMSSSIAVAETLPTLNTVLGGADSSSPYDLYAPGATGYIRLSDTNDISLVDTSARISGAGITQTNWDQFTVGDLPVGPHTLTVTAGVDTVASVVFEVASPDSIRSSSSSTLSRGEASFACFSARRGIVPVHAHFDSISSNAATVEPSQYEGCVNITATQVGTITVHVSAAGLARDFELQSNESSARVATTDTAASEATAGERASSLAAE